jgi:hypothetical protein
VLAAPGAGAQVCLGGSPVSRGWIAVAHGPASGAATIIGADFAWKLPRSFALYGDGGVTRYPASDPARKRLALGLAYAVRTSEQSAICLVSGIESQRIGDLHVSRVPVGVSAGWNRSFSNGRGTLGLRLAPLLAFSRESIANYTHDWAYAISRTGVVLGYDRLIFGVEHEHAFDNDARWNVRARFGFALD